MNKPENNLKSRRNKRFAPLKTSNIKFPEEKIKAAYWVHVLIWSLLGIVLFFSVSGIIWPRLLWHHFEFVNYPLHSTIESLGAIAAILIAFMPLQVLFGKYRPSFLFLSTGFLVMGLLDLFHSFLREGHGFVFTHAMALLAGSFLFAFFVFPWKFNADKAKKYFLLVSALITITLAAISSIYRDFFPEMINDGIFTPTANNINLVAGIFFFISAIKLFVIYTREKNLGVLILVFTAFSSAIVGITFEYSSAWSDGWWLWHTIRLIAFLSLLGYMLWRIQAVSQERNEALDSIKEKHNQLQASEERFSLVNEATKQGLWDWNVPKNEIYFSPVWKMQVGYNDDELENDFANWAKLLHPEDKEWCLKAVDDYLKNPEGKFILEFRFQHKDGHYVWIHNQAASVKDEDGNVLRMFGSHTDFTAQKEAEERLKEQEKKFRIIFENSPIGKSQTGLDGSLNINKAFSEITGYNLEELKQKNWKEITHPDDIKESEEIIKSLIVGEKDSARFEKRYLHKNGHYVWTEVNTSLNRNEAGEPQFFITTISDITQRKEAEKQIKQSEKKFKGLFESDPSAIIIADPQTGILQDVNPSAEKLMEMSRDELIGLHQSKLHPEEEMKKQIEKFKQLQGQPNVTVNSVVLTKTGKRKQVEIKVSMVEIENKPYILGIFHDISKLIKEQQKLKQSQEKHQAIFESATDAFIIVNMEGKIAEVNPSTCQLYGYNYNEIIGMDVPSIIHPDYHHKFTEFMNDIQEKGSYSGETVDLRKDGSTFQSEVNGTIINFNNEPHMLGVIRDVSDKKAWENELTLKNIVYESSIAANSTADLDGKLTSVNPSFLKTWGYENKNEVLGKPIPNFIKYEKEAIEIFEGLNANGRWKGNYTALKKDGSTFIAQANSSVLYNAEGEKIGYQSSIFDVTEQLNAEAAINEEKEFTDSIINSMPGIFYLFDQNGKFLKWNNTLAELSGLSFEEVGTKSPYDIIAPHHRKKVGEAIKTVFKKGNVLVEADFLEKGKSPVPFLFTGKRIIRDNEPLLVGVGINITKRLKAEQEKEKALHNLNERMKEITCLFEVNEAIKDPEVSIPETMDKITQSIPKGWQYSKNTCVKVVLKDQEFKSKNFKESVNFIEEPIVLGKKKLGKIQVFLFDLNKEQEKSLFLKEEKQLLFTIANNIGIYISRVESTQKLNNAIENLQRSNKELERFAYVASHDLQEPLRMVSSYTQLLERRYKGQMDDRADKYIHYAVDGANRMQNLINDLLDFSRISTRGEKFKKTDTAEVVKNTLNNLEARINETGAQIIIGKLPVIKADTGQIERLFLNLIGNALKFMKPDEKPVIKINAKEQKDKWLFSVNDNGIGIDEKFNEKVFVIFQRLHGAAKYKGTGIGLAICKRIIQRHDGKIWFESEENKGTTFFFTLKKHNLEADKN